MDGDGRECSLVMWRNGPAWLRIYSRPSPSIRGLFSVAGLVNFVLQAPPRLHHRGEDGIAFTKHLALPRSGYNETEA